MKTFSSSAWFHAVSLPAALLGLALLATGCGRDVYVADDIDVDLDFSLSGPEDALHQPYVLGTPVTISARPSDGDEDTSGWWFVSSDPEVIDIQSQDAGAAKCLAASAGQSTLSVYASLDDSEPMRTVVLEVRQPDRVELFAHGPLIVRQPDDAARVEQPRIVDGGQATFLVRYFQGNTRLFGNRVLGLQPSTQLTAESDSTFLFENQDWLRLSPRAIGPHSLRVLASGIDIGTVTVHGVDANSIRRLDLLGEPERDARAEQTLTVLAQAYDDSNARVFGASLAWDLDGSRQTGFGDLFRYRYAPDAARQLAVTDGSTSTQSVIHASEGSVSESVATGCSLSRRGPAGLLALAAPAAALLLIARRRRAA